MNQPDFFREWSRVHGNAKVSGIVLGWLRISYWLTRLLAVTRISPNLLSLIAISMGAVFLWFIESNWSALFLVAALLLDGIDGTLAITTGKTTKFGALLDSVSDRLVESCWAYGLYLLGAPWQIVSVAWAAAFLQEYLRARAGGLGINQVLIVTICERPVRASIIFIALVARAFELNLVLPAAALWAILQSISAIMLLRVLRSRL